MIETIIVSTLTGETSTAGVLGRKTKAGDTSGKCGQFARRNHVLREIRTRRFEIARYNYKPAHTVWM